MTGPTLILGDCVEAMARMEPCSVDAVVCDPPYELAFMGKGWDAAGVSFRPETWAAALRVLKPGGHLLAFGGTRTVHRIAVAIEDAGFDVRDMIAWMYGSGFPKSLDVAKAIDSAAGVEGAWRQEDHPSRPGGRGPSVQIGTRIGQLNRQTDENPDGLRHVYEPSSDDAREWQGWGTALKPAFEPVVVARKPFPGTVAANVLAHGTGAINVDGCRVDVGGETISVPQSDPSSRVGVVGSDLGISVARTQTLGRWPANVVLGHTEECVLVGHRTVTSDGHHPSARPAGSALAGASGHAGQDGLEERYARGELVEEWDCHPGCAVRLLDEQTGTLTSGQLLSHHRRGGASRLGTFEIRDRTGEPCDFGGDSGGASRFFYCAKTSRAERNAGLAGFEEGTSAAVENGPNVVRRCGECGRSHPNGHRGPCVRCGSDRVEVEAALMDGTGRSGPAAGLTRNPHPTVKPVALMRWLVRLVTPPGGLVLDPFMGSGTTGIAAALEGMRFVGVEQDPGYLRVAEARIGWWAGHGEDALDAVRRRERSDDDRRAAADAGQLDLFAV